VERSNAFELLLNVSDRGQTRPSRSAAYTGRLRVCARTTATHSFHVVARQLGHINFTVQVRYLLTYLLTFSFCMDWPRHTSPTSVDQSQPSVADKDSDPPLVATLLSPPLSRTLPPVHLLWRVRRPGINCRCTYEHGRQSVPSRRH